VGKQEKEVALGKDNVLTPVGSTLLQYKLPISYFNIIFGICLSTKENMTLFNMTVSVFILVPL